MGAGSIPVPAPIPQSSDVLGEESTPRARTAAAESAPNHVVATPPPPPAAGLPTIMDESPTPLRQMHVSVLAGQPPPDTPVGSLRANVARRSLPAKSGQVRGGSGAPLAAGLVSTPSGSPATNLFGALATPSPTPGLSPATPASPTPAPHAAHMISPAMMSCWPTITHATTTAQVDTSVSEGSRNQSSSDVQSWDTGETHVTLSNINALGARIPQRQLTDVSTVVSATSSVSLYSEMDENWVTPAVSHRETDDTDSEGGLSEATLPELLPVSSTSALSHYEDARQGSLDWTVHEETEEDFTPPNERRSATPGTSHHVVDSGDDRAKSAVTPPATSAAFTTLSSLQDRRTPTRQDKFALDGEDQNRESTSPEADSIESLMITPRAKLRSPHTPGTNATEPFEYDQDRRSPATSLSSGSDEGSMRHSMDENFRGLFFRTPQVAAGPSTARRPSTAPTTVPRMINPPARSDSRRPGTAPRATVLPFGEQPRRTALPFGEQPVAESPPMVTAETTPVEEKLFSFVAGAGETVAARPPQPYTSTHDEPKPLTSVLSWTPRPLTSIHNKHSASDPSGGALGSPIRFQQVSPHRGGHIAKRTLSSEMDTQSIPPTSLDLSLGRPINAPHAHGLGVVMTPQNPTGDPNLSGWDHVSRIGPSTPPIATLPRDDSWISASMLYCIEYLEANFDWLVEQLDALLEPQGGNGYIIIDTPGQAELWTNHDSLKRIVNRLLKLDYRLAAVHLTDAHAITDASKYISAVLLALRAMLQLEMPHINVFSKIDTIGGFGELSFNLDYYTEVQDLSYLVRQLEDVPRAKRFAKLNAAMVELIEEFSLVGFETLAVEDKASMMHLVRLIDKVTGYVFMPSGGTTEDNLHALFSSASGTIPGGYADISDVQERWGEGREAFDKAEEERWEREWAMRKQAEALTGADDKVDVKDAKDDEHMT
ncbi:hypothetical protein CspeluHIS016_0602310 [Cutaneotrichosporon spelunceum]|uniref:GPN-loop GTPase 2 n=1 Tax=Cutaneotrichosporon spelunceum TaxID=1672016 RepID=A0AAD3TYD3_9TREE|nr:hypothetical protein CspeluHIS016_0602310 [Cutaneotrichosporon spelunceum]